MESDIESTFNTSLPPFIRLSPEGFEVGNAKKRFLEVAIYDEQVVRAFWKNGILRCQSADGLRSLRTGKPCRLCRNQRSCTPRIVLYLLFAEEPYRLALSYSSSRNYLAYRRELKLKGLTPADALTRLSLCDHGSWCEVKFHLIM